TGENITVSDGAEKKPSAGFQDSFNSGLLKRRYVEFIRSRSDLLERLHTMETKLSSEENELKNRLNTVCATRQEIRQLLTQIPAEDPGREAFADRGELADTTLKIEKQRIEMMRMLPIVDGASEKIRSINGRKMPGVTGNAEPGIVLDSLTFRQICRIAFAAATPFFIAILLSSLIIAIAIIGSFNGLF
ncbi:MAG: hypothetical protein J6Q65_00480, partial [Lentisphaeria bacterium]|nr:hypothetical protein [Lentisphaeria bacterium]